MENKNERTRKDKGDPRHRRGVGVPSPNSENDGTQRTRGIDQEDSAGSDCIGTVTSEFRSSPLGKILDRAELLERSFYNYVHAHQERLETRLEESKQLESTFTDSLKALKQEIYDLAKQQKQVDTGDPETSH